MGERSFVSQNRILEMKRLEKGGTAPLLAVAESGIRELNSIDIEYLAGARRTRDTFLFFTSY